MSRSIKSILCGAACVLGLGLGAAQAATNLVNNGDFESGDTGFTSGLLPGNVGSTAGVYEITADSNGSNGFFGDFGDHTTGSGNMMIVNGSTSGNLLAWQQSVMVQAGATYDFTLWIASAFGIGDSDFTVFADGDLIDSPSTRGAPGVGVWEQFGGSWTAGSTGVIDLQIFENSTGFVGNDYAFDDISFAARAAPIPLPAAGGMLLAALGGLALVKRGRSRS